jgi:hypothetical protein
MKYLRKAAVLGTKFVCWPVLVIALVASGSLVHAALPTVASGGNITLMTRNLYVGAAFDPLLNASTPSDVPGLVAQIYATILSSQFPCRAEAIADEIVQNKPNLVGLQEAELLRVYSPCGALISNPTKPMAFAMDYVQILLDALERRSVHYAVAASVTNTDVTVTSETGDTIRLTDRDVILVRTDLPPSEFSVSNPRDGNFKTNFTVQIGGAGGPSLTVLRGWCSVDVKVGGKLVQVVSTHLEDSVPLIQSAQADELVAGPLRTSHPVIVIGDFNASPNSTIYASLIKAGFQDAWALANPSDPGLSCCQAGDLLNPTSQLSMRIDLILFHSGRISVNNMVLVGANSTDRLTSGQWPSDHAGVVGTLSIK